MDSLSKTTDSVTGDYWSNITLNSIPSHDVWQNASGLLAEEEDRQNTAQMGKEKEEFFSVFLKHLDNYVLPVIILLGIVGNIISFTGECLHLLR